MRVSDHGFSGSCAVNDFQTELIAVIQIQSFTDSISKIDGTIDSNGSLDNLHSFYSFLLKSFSFLTVTKVYHIKLELSILFLKKIFLDELRLNFSS